MLHLVVFKQPTSLDTIECASRYTLASRAERHNDIVWLMTHGESLVLALVTVLRGITCERRRVVVNDAELWPSVVATGVDTQEAE